MNKSKRNPVVVGDGTGAFAALCGVCGDHGNSCGGYAACGSEPRITAACKNCKHFRDAIIIPSKCYFTGERIYADSPGCDFFAGGMP
jgi:hypothetical protein